MHTIVHTQIMSSSNMTRSSLLEVYNVWLWLSTIKYLYVSTETDRQTDRQRERHTHTQNLHSKKRHTHTQKLHSKKHTNKDLTCSLYWFISSKDFWLLTANTQRKPSPVRMYWSRIALKQIRTTSTIPMHWCSHETWTGANVSGYKHFGLIL